MHNIALRDIMITKVITAHEEDKMSWVEEKMRMQGIRHLPVVDVDKWVMGIITQGDLVGCVPPRRLEDGTLRFDHEQLDGFILQNVMTKNPQTLTPADTLLHAVSIMERDKYGCIPITESKTDKTLVGIVTQRDVLKWLCKKLNE